MFYDTEIDMQIVHFKQPDEKGYINLKLALVMSLDN